MKISENISLSSLTTMRLGGLARYVIEIEDITDLVEAVKFARKQSLPWFVLGSGSNVIASGDYEGAIILNRIQLFEKIGENIESATYRVGAGEVWDKTVDKFCTLELSGVEAMSAIPGYVGATPIQNVGAYGQEIADTLIELEAYDTDIDKFVTLSHGDCKFSYRNSIFKNPKTRHHIITNLTLRLDKTPLSPPFYPALEKYLKDNMVNDYSPHNIRRAVIAVRTEKLPPVDKVASAGSFFKNPILNKNSVSKLLEAYPNMPHWDMPDGQVKLAAGWLIEQTGLKGFGKYGMQIYPNNALVVVNVNAKSITDLELFKSEIVSHVKETFGVKLDTEPESL